MLKPSYLFLAIMAFVAFLAANLSSAEDLPAAALALRFLGQASLFLLSVTLMMGPAAVIWPKHFASLIEPRRAVGVASFVFVVPHFFILMGAFMNWNFAAMLGFPQLAIGYVAMIIMLALTLTSTDWAVRTLGNERWKWLHRGVYVAFLLAVYHSVVQITTVGLDKDKNMSLAQALLLLLAGLAIVLQIAGFYVRRQRAGGAKASEPEKKPNVPAEPAG